MFRISVVLCLVYTLTYSRCTVPKTLIPTFISLEKNFRLCLTGITGRTKSVCLQSIVVQPTRISCSLAITVFQVKHLRAGCSLDCPALGVNSSEPFCKYCCCIHVIKDFNKITASWFGFKQVCGLFVFASCYSQSVTVSQILWISER